MSRAQRLKNIVDDEDFQSVISALEKRLTGVVMSAATSEEDRNKALSQYHGLRALMGSLRAEVQNIEEE